MWCVVYVGGFTFREIGCVLVTIDVYVIVLNFVLVDNKRSARRLCSTHVFSIHHIGLTPTIAFFNFVVVVITVV